MNVLSFSLVRFRCGQNRRSTRMHILLKNTCVCNISDNICPPRFRRLRSILISLPVWRLIWFLHRSQLFGHCSNISEVQGRDHMLLYMSPWHVGNIIALLFNRLLLIGSVSAWKISSLLIKLCIMGSRWSLWIGISSHIKDHLIDLFSGSVQKALRIYLIAFVISDASYFLLSFYPPRRTGPNRETSAAQILLL